MALRSRSAQGSNPARSGNGIALPPMQHHAFSTELVLNTRRSYHSGYSGSLPDQVLANVLLAGARAPLIGAGRTIYVARPDNVYRYDPLQHALTVHTPGNQMFNASHAFEVGVICDVPEDAGAAQLFGHLAVTAFWSDVSNQPAGCTMEYATWHANDHWGAGELTMVNVYGSMETVAGMTSNLVAVSSDGSLPDPSMDGSVAIEDAWADLHWTSQFAGAELTLGELAQMAWASYGATDHTNVKGHAGLTVGSAMASYFLTGRIYIVRSVGVDRYHVRLPGGGKTTRDHRIERVTEGDAREALHTAVPRIPSTAPNYLVFCADEVERIRSVEAGFAGAAVLLQATALDLGGHLSAGFSTPERSAIVAALGLPADDLPLLVCAVGQPAAPKRRDVDHRIKEVEAGARERIEAARTIDEYMGNE